MELCSIRSASLGPSISKSQETCSWARPCWTEKQPLVHGMSRRRVALGRAGTMRRTRSGRKGGQQLSALGGVKGVRGGGRILFDLFAQRNSCFLRNCRIEPNVIPIISPARTHRQCGIQGRRALDSRSHLPDPSFRCEKLSEL